MANCPLYASIGAGDALRPGGSFVCVDSQQIGQAPAGTVVNCELDPVRLYLVAGNPIFQSAPPTPTQFADLMAASGLHLIYLEVWENTTTIIGFGWVDYYYIGVYY